MPDIRQRIAAYFADLPASRLQQVSGDYHPTRPCCVGAHLAHILGVSQPGDAPETDFLRGADAWAQAVGGNRAHAILLLRNAGAPHDPFGPARWPTPPAAVFARLMTVEQLPETAAADFTRCTFANADLRAADLSHVKLSMAGMRQANLEGANLRYANLNSANLWQAKLPYADLTGARVHGATIVEADLTGARLTRVDLSTAFLHGTHVEGAIMRPEDAAALQGRRTA